ncbi:MAG TPA: hypothetical protein VII56_19780 [Rhizomicrobium sp.]
MLTHKAVRELVKDVLTRVLPKTEVSKIDVRDYADAIGEDSLEITIILAKGKVVGLSGRDLTKALGEIQTSLSRQGDDRFPNLRYLTAHEAKQLAS